MGSSSKEQMNYKILLLQYNYIVWFRLNNKLKIFYYFKEFFLYKYKQKLLNNIKLKINKLS